VGLLQTRINIKPIKLSGVTITHATAFNAKFVKNNDLGPGAKVELIRSGDVIPYIIKVVSKAKGGAQMPKDKYEWNETGVDIVSVDVTDEMCINRIEDFLKKLDIKFVGPKNVENMYRDGLDSVLAIVSASQSRIAKVPGYGDKGAERAYTNIQAGLKNMDVATVLGASGVFGRGMGSTKINTLLDEIPDLFEIYKNIDRDTLYNRVMDVSGFSNKSTELIVNNISNADRFLDAMRKFGTFKGKKVEVVVDSKLKDMVVVFTGTRDNDAMKRVDELGGKIGKTITKATNILVYGAGKGEKDTKKMDKAKAQGIEILTTDEFIAKYLTSDVSS